MISSSSNASKQQSLSLFDATHPFESMAKLSNGIYYLNDFQINLTVSDLCQFFTRLSYHNITTDIPKEFFERFRKIDLPFLLKNIKSPIEKMRILKNVEKVTKNYFSELNAKYSLSHIQVDLEDCNKHLTSIWGWIAEDYLNTEWESEEKIGILKNMSPSSLLALQQLQCADLNSKLDLPIESLGSLFCFAIESSNKPLIRLTTFVLRNISNEDYCKFSNYIVSHHLEDPHICKAISETIKRKLMTSRALRSSERLVVNQINNKIVNDIQRSQPIKFESDYPSEIISPWFNPEMPFKSIADFTDNFASLSRRDHKIFFSAVQNFFIHKSAQGENIEIPQEFKKRFAKIDLPFLLIHAPDEQCSQVSEKDRLVANIQKITKTHFSSLGNDQVFCTLIKCSDLPIEHLNYRYGWFKHLFLKNPKKISQKKGYGPETLIEFKNISAQLFDIFFRLQYPIWSYIHHLSKKISLENLRDLFLFSLERFSKPLIDTIFLVIRFLPNDKLAPFSTFLVKNLENPLIHHSLHESKFGLLFPSHKGLSNQELFNTLAFNLSFFPFINMEKISIATFGRTPRLDLLYKFLIELEKNPQLNENKISALKLYLRSQFKNSFQSLSKESIKFLERFGLFNFLFSEKKIKFEFNKKEIQHIEAKEIYDHLRKNEVMRLFKVFEIICIREALIDGLFLLYPTIDIPRMHIERQPYNPNNLCYDSS